MIKSIPELTTEIYESYQESKLDARDFINSFNDKINACLKEFGHTSKIPPDHEFWEIKSKISLLKKMAADGSIELFKREPKTRKETYQLLKYGFPKDRISRETKNDPAINDGAIDAPIDTTPNR